MIKLLWSIIWGAPGPKEPVVPECIHEWATITQTTSGPLRLDQMPDLYEDLFFEDQERLLRGVTSILRSCRKCGDDVVHEMIGQPVQ